MVVTLKGKENTSWRWRQNLVERRLGSQGKIQVSYPSQSLELNILRGEAAKILRYGSASPRNM